MHTVDTRMPRDAYPQVGELVLIYAGMPSAELRPFVAQADPIVKMRSAMLLMLSGHNDDVTISGPPPNRIASLVGAIVRINGSNRTVVYRIAAYERLEDQYLLQWPD